MATLTISYLYTKTPDSLSEIPPEDQMQRLDVSDVGVAHSSFDGSGIPGYPNDYPLALIHITNFPDAALGIIQMFADAAADHPRPKPYVILESALTTEQQQALADHRQVVVDFATADALNFLRPKLVADINDWTQDSAGLAIDFGALMP